MAALYEDSYIARNIVVRGCDHSLSTPGSHLPEPSLEALLSVQAYMTFWFGWSRLLYAPDFYSMQKLLDSILFDDL